MLAMEWMLGLFTSLLCLHGAPFRPRGLGSVVSVVPAPEMERHVRVRLALLLSAAGQHHDILRLLANRRRTQERPKPRRLHRSEAHAQLSRLHFPPSRLNYCIKMPIEVGALPLSTQLFINNEFVDAKSGTKVRAATAPRGHLRSACSVRAGPLTTAPCSSTPSTRRPRR